MKFANVILTIAALVLMAGAASAQNVLVNGDFETGDLTGWEINGESGASSVTIETGDNGPTLPGNNNAFMSNFGEAIGLNMKQTTAPGSVGGGTLNYSFDLKLDQADVGGVLFAEIFCEQEGVGIVGGSGLMGPFWPWNVWETFSGSFAAPANTDFITIQFVATTGAAVGTNCVAHVDNVSVSGPAVPVQADTWSGVKALYR
jgi:hypothetical protein